MSLQLHRDGKLLVIIGPSGAGKSSAIELLHAREIIDVTPSWTTRPPRPEETSGTLEHMFASEAEFANKKAAGYFLEAVQPFGLPYWYGLPKITAPPKGRVALVMLRVNLLPLLRKHYSNFTIYQIEDSLPKIKRRLQAREAAGQPLGSRLKDYQHEIDAGRQAAHRVFTNDTSVEALSARIEAALVEDQLAR